MALRAALTAVLLLALPLTANAQTTLLHGRIVDRGTHAPVVGARVRLTAPADSTDVRATTSTRDDGSFAFPPLARRALRLEATRIGYVPLRQSVTLAGADQDLGTLQMTSTALPIRGISIESSPPPARQVADTTEFAAGSVRTNPDATAEDLVSKLPGLTVDNSGTVKSNGEQVQQVLVNGKPYFSNDPTIAMRNLPADVIDKIQVYDKMSDQSEFTGFDDGNAVKTMNFVLRPDRAAQRFGKLYGGYGDQDRYLAGGNGNLMRDKTRLSVIGLANNVNQQNFSSQDLLGVLNTGGQRGGGLFVGGGPGGRRPGGPRRGGGGGFGGPGGDFGGFGGPGPGNFLVGQQDGISTTKSIGENYNGTWAKGLEVNQTWFFNDVDNVNDQTLARAYSLPVDSVARYAQQSGTENKNRNHRLDSRIVWTADSTNSFIDIPRLGFQSNHTDNAASGANTTALGDPVSEATNQNSSATTGNNLSNHLVYRHRFPKRGRTFSVDFGLASTLKEGTSGQQSHATYTGAPSDTVSQRARLHTTTSSVTSRIVYTEPAGAGLVMASYAPGVTRSASDSRASAFDPLTGDYTLPDSARSNTFKSTYTTQGAGLGYLRGGRGARLMLNLAWQQSRLQADREFPVAYTVDRTFDDLLPSLMLNRGLRDGHNLRIFWRTSTQAPTINQLQDVVDNSNPLVLQTGNPNLKQAYNHTVVVRWSSTDPQRSRSKFLFLSLQRTSSTIANATLTAARDTVLAGGLLLHSGTQLVTPVNLGTSWNASTFGTYSRPVGFVKSLLNLNTGVTWTRMPGLVNGVDNQADTWALSQGVVLASNISEALDFTLGYTGTYNIARNTANASANSDYYTHVASFKLNVITWHGVTMRHELSNNLTSGVAGDYAQDIVLWNASLGEKFLKNERGELRVTATDVLHQNQSVSRTVTETYIQDSRNATLQRYVMATFTYTFK